MSSKTSSLEIHGHRGSRGTHPENTLAGFRAALNDGADVLELDVGWSRDEVVVVHHDEALNPEITRRNGVYVESAVPIRDLTYAELSEFDVGRIRSTSAYAKRFSGQVAVDGERIPSFCDVLDLGAPLNVEIKVSPRWPDDQVRGFVDCVLSDIEGARAHSRVAIQSFDWRVFDVIGDAGLPLACLTSDRTHGPRAEGGWTGRWQLGNERDLLEVVRATGATTWSPEFRGVKPRAGISRP